MFDSKDSMAMLAASMMAYNIKGGKLPVYYRIRIDEWLNGRPVNWYKMAGFTDKIYTFSAGLNNIHAGLMGIAGNRLIIALRGTDGDGTLEGSILDWLNNFIALPVPFTPYSRGFVHAGFLSAAESLKTDMLTQAVILYDKLKVSGLEPEIIVTGHSKGGAVACLMAEMLAEINKEEYKSRISVYTFGAPRVGDRIFAENYKLKHYRYEAFLDIVCHLPLTEQEMTLLKRLGPVQELFAECFKLPAYKSVGEEICVYHEADNFGAYPADTINISGETLNSFCAIEQVIRYGALQILSNSHGKDYYLLDKYTVLH
jgi:hypothetical protein